MAWDKVGNLCYYSGLICCAIGIVHRDCIVRGACRVVVQLGPFNVNEASGHSTAVHKGLGTSLDCCVHHFNLNVDTERH
jgi:hypothetical protein